MTSTTINVDGNLNLVVAWNAGAAVEGRMVNLGKSVAEALREAATTTAAQLRSGHPYDPDVDIEDSTHLVAERSELLDTDLIGALEGGTGLTLATDDEIGAKRILCYAAVIGSGPSRSIFVRKRNPIRLAKRTTLATWADGTLNKVEEPLFGFDDRFDAVITQDKVYVIDKRNFELMFKESEAVLAKAPTWVDELAAAVPLAEPSKAVLIDGLRRNSIYRSKFHAILRRPYLSSLTPVILQKKMIEHQLDPAVLMPNGELDFSSENIKDLLRLLNEDLFKGDFSDEQYAAGSKRRMS